MFTLTLAFWVQSRKAGWVHVVALSSLLSLVLSALLKLFIRTGKRSLWLDDVEVEMEGLFV